MTAEYGGGERPFGPADPRTDGERLADVMRVQRQVIKMDTARYDVERSRRLLDLMRERRRDRTDLVRIGEIPDRQGGTTLAVETELLIRTRDLPWPPRHARQRS